MYIHFSFFILPTFNQDNPIQIHLFIFLFFLRKLAQNKQQQKYITLCVAIHTDKTQIEEKCICKE